MCPQSKGLPRSQSSLKKNYFMLHTKTICSTVT